MIIKNGLIFTEQNTFSNGTIRTKDDTITELFTDDTEYDSKEDVLDATDCYVIPGLTDIHFHGCNGHDFCEGTTDAFDAITTFELAHGVTSVCPATMTLADEALSDICRNAAEYHHTQSELSPSDKSDFIGIHMEGPFISANKKGAQNATYIQTPTAAKLRKWQTDAQGLIRLVSLAPEIDGALSCIKECCREFRFSIAHTEADYDTALEAFAAGADHVTHLYNAMPPLTHRAPGVIGAASDTQNCFVELICDGVHIAPAVVRASFRLFGDDRVILISDSMEATGKPDGSYSLGGQTVYVNGNKATLADGTIAGSATPLYECLLTAVSMGIPLESAIKAATINPCRSIGMDSLYGSIQTGKKAHFLLLRRKDLSLKAVVKGQHILWS